MDLVQVLSLKKLGGSQYPLKEAHNRAFYLKHLQSILLEVDRNKAPKELNCNAVITRPIII